MEQQEEKTIQIYERKIASPSSSSSKPISSFPHDIVSEILVKLPVKSIVRFRCVSKLWSSTTTDPYFIKSFESRVRPKQSLLIFFKRNSKFVVFSFPQHDRNLNGESYSSYSSQHVDRYQLKYPKYNCFHSPIQSVHGLIGLPTSSTPIIWNPSMRQFLTLPKLETNWKASTIFFLGYDPIEGKYKVLCMPDLKFCSACQVLTLKSSSAQESNWRMIKTNLNHKICSFRSKARCINGVLYYEAILPLDLQRVIVCFDVRSETFQPIRFPLGTKWHWSDWMIAYEGRLAFVHSEKNVKGIKMLVLENAEKEEWSHKSFCVSLKHYDFSLKTSFRLSGVTDGGELIYLPFMFLKSFTMLYYDPKRDSFRKVAFEGIADDEFRLSKELGNRSFYDFWAFPNCIDSFITW